MIGTIVSHYRILEKLGGGGMGVVYRAMDTRLDRPVALKFLTVELSHDQDAKLRFIREAKAASSLDHPNICILHDIGESADGQLFLVMPHYAGETLKRRIERGPLPLSEAIRIATQIAEGLEKAHASGIVHRDIKPANVILTEDGGVKLVDFGLAKLLNDASLTGSGTAVGTPAYMSPEQIRGAVVDPRADLWALGVVLYEMVTGQKPYRGESDQAMIHSILNEESDPIEAYRAEVPEDLEKIIRKLLQKDLKRRYQGARELISDLRTWSDASRTPTLQRLARQRRERISPYPGLASFTEAESEYFFGREAEIDSMWRKLAGPPRLLALIGPSGAGKSSFFRAGVIPVQPQGWQIALLTPGNRPFVALARALVPGLAGDADAVASLVEIEKPAVAVEALRTWRGTHESALLVIDQFEELFTLNPPDVQERFANVLGSLGIHVLLSMRDDFLIRCHDYDSLAVVFSDLTPLTAPTGDALRHALVEPAAKCGYRFEDEMLVEAILAQVTGERGALPLAAFAMARLWEKRDRERGLLTRAAYEEIGGVAGALAQHAEATLERIGADRMPIVRELFRQLVTAHGTRAARDRDELLSVFAKERGANAVLDALVQARLLTAYDGKEERARIEIVHESLLGTWPRLVRWQSQDAEGALLRDHLRQAAQLWDERGQPEDLLWSGTAYREFVVWRDRYSGALTTAEQHFVNAMTDHAERRKRRAWLFAGVALAAAIGIAVAMGVLWQRSASQTLRAEAEKLLAIAQFETEWNPTNAFAYATKSLELADTLEARIRVLDILWRGPVAQFLPMTSAAWSSITFSPDGGHIAIVRQLGDDFIVSSSGRITKVENTPPTGAWPQSGWFTADGHLLMIAGGGDPAVRFFSVGDGRLVRTLSLPNDAAFALGDMALFSISWTDATRRQRVLRSWPFAGGESQVLGHFAPAGPYELHRSGTWFAEAREGTVYRELLDGQTREVLWVPREKPKRLVFNGAGDHLAAVGDSGVDVWSIAEKRRQWLPLPGKPSKFFSGPQFDKTGSRFVWASQRGEVWVWSLQGPPEAEPLHLRLAGRGEISDAAFHPSGQWITSPTPSGPVAFWPLGQPYWSTIRGVDGAPMVRFTPDSTRLIACSSASGLYLFSLHPPSESKKLPRPQDRCDAIAIHPSGSAVLAEGWGSGALLVPLSGDAPRQLMAEANSPVALSVDGRMAAMHLYSNDPTRRVLKIWDSRTDTTRTFPVITQRRPEGGERPIHDMGFAYDGTFYTAGDGGIRRWDLVAGTSHVVDGGEAQTSALAMSADGKFMLAAVGRGTPPYTPITGELILFDLVRRSTRRITSHGSDFSAIAIDRTGKVIMTGDGKGLIRISGSSGEDPHLLVGHQQKVNYLEISPDGRWIASTTRGAEIGEIRLWPVPDLTKIPLHRLSHDRLMAKLHELTNLRAVPDRASSNGYKLEIGPFPGWEKVPEW